MAEVDAIGSLTTLRRGREGGGRGSAVSGAILFDAARLPQARAEWFDPDYWGERARAVHAGGRGSAWFVDAPFGDAVLRHYLRGGMAARMSRDRYLWQGEQRTRSFAEYRLTETLWQLGLPVPRPLAASYEREGATYRAAILLDRLHGVRTFAECVAATPDEAPWERTGRLIASFHRAGIDHADLNANNILFDGSGKGWLIDFDRGQLRIPATAWRERNLARLQRSLLKLRGQRPADEVLNDVARLRRAYDATWLQGI